MLAIAELLLLLFVVVGAAPGGGGEVLAFALFESLKDPYESG